MNPVIIRPLNPSESDKRKTTDKINELVRHNTVPPWAYYDMTDLTCLLNTYSLSLAVFFNFSVPFTFALRTNWLISSDTSGGKVDFQESVQWSRFADGSLVDSPYQNVSDHSLTPEDYNLVKQTGFLSGGHVANPPAIYLDAKAEPAMYRLFITIRTTVGLATVTKGNCLVHFKPHYGEDLEPFSPSYV